MWIVALSSLKQCAKTYEIRHTPTPVRVTEALQAAVLEGCGTTREPGEGKGGTSTCLWDSSSTGPSLITTTAGAQLRAAILRDGGAQHHQG